MSEEKRFDVEFAGTGRATGKMRNDISVTFTTTNETFELATDEGSFHGGDGTAAPPLALFTAALIGCVMTQIRAFSKRMKIDIGAVEVSAKMHWEGRQVGREPYVTAPVGFSLDIDLDSSASSEDQMRLIDAAKQGCFIEQTLKTGISVDHRLKIGKTGGMPDLSKMENNASPRRRLSSEERRAEFIQKSIRLFAENGFESSTRELARRLGVTQPLLYRYFPSKQELVSAVYDEVYVRRWRPEWEDLIADRSRPLQDRLVEFYSVYTDAIYHPDWIRIYLYSGLKGEEINTRYMRVVVSKILGPILNEVRHEVGDPPQEPTPEEIDKMWMFHGGIFYFGVVKLVYQKTAADGKQGAIAFAVKAMVETFKTELIEAQTPREG